jgi:hypothetical protein
MPRNMIARAVIMFWASHRAEKAMQTSPMDP